MENIMILIEKISSILWDGPMLLLIFGTGVFFTIKTRFFQISKIKYIAKETIFSLFKNKKNNSDNEISQLQAISTALAATIGTGNIIGVATAISSGGTGAIFWMWVCAFFSMMISYFENVLGIYYRKKNKSGQWAGGAMYYLENGLKERKKEKLGKILATLFSVFCVLGSFGMGNMTQVNSISDSIKTVFLNLNMSVNPLSIGIVIATIGGIVIIGGVKRVGKVTEKLVPFMAGGYILSTLIILCLSYKQIPFVMSSIFENAFSFASVGGGISGTVIKKAVDMGFKRGVFSSEAGVGSSVSVHSASNTKEPVVQGMWGIFQVFFDTIVVCSLTAFVIIISINNVDIQQVKGVALVNYAFSNYFGNFAGVIISLCLILFAFSTVLGWSFYGEKAVEYIFKGRFIILYKVIFILFMVLGSVVTIDIVWGLADILNALMAIPNLIGVLFLYKKVLKITENYKIRKINKNPRLVNPMLSAYNDIQHQQYKKLLKENNIISKNKK